MYCSIALHFEYFAVSTVAHWSAIIDDIDWSGTAIANHFFFNVLWIRTGWWCVVGGWWCVGFVRAMWLEWFGILLFDDIHEISIGHRVHDLGPAFWTKIVVATPCRDTRTATDMAAWTQCDWWIHVTTVGFGTDETSGRVGHGWARQENVQNLKLIWRETLHRSKSVRFSRRSQEFISRESHFKNFSPASRSPVRWFLRQHGNIETTFIVLHRHSTRCTCWWHTYRRRSTVRLWESRRIYGSRTRYSDRAVKSQYNLSLINPPRQSTYDKSFETSCQMT